MDSITTLVACFSRQVHSVPLSSTNSSRDFADSFFADSFRHRGLPNFTTSDRDPNFTSKFWDRLTALCGIRFRISTRHQPQADSSSELMNRMVINFLRCYCAHHQRDWDALLHSAEFAYKLSTLDSSGRTPFELDFGWSPESPLSMLHSSGTLTRQSVDDFKTVIRNSFQDAQFAQELAQARQALYNSQHNIPHSYQAGAQVLLNRKYFFDYYSSSQPSHKLCAGHFGPFVIAKVIG